MPVKQIAGPIATWNHPKRVDKLKLIDVYDMEFIKQSHMFQTHYSYLPNYIPTNQNSTINSQQPG